MRIELSNDILNQPVLDEKTGGFATPTPASAFDRREVIRLKIAAI
jgi:hypothetical protein